MINGEMVDNMIIIKIYVHIAKYKNINVIINGESKNHHHHNKNNDDIFHYTDVIMIARASQITSLMIVYSTVYSGADQRKHESSAPSLAFVRGIHRWIPRTKGQ